MSSVSAALVGPRYRVTRPVPVKPDGRAPMMAVRCAICCAESPPAPIKESDARGGLGNKRFPICADCMTAMVHATATVRAPGALRISIRVLTAAIESSSIVWFLMNEASGANQEFSESERSNEVRASLVALPESGTRKNLTPWFVSRFETSESGSRFEACESDSLAAGSKEAGKSRKRMEF